MINLDDALAAWPGAQIHNWAPEGVAKRIDLEGFVLAAMTTILPPWRPIPSRSAARMLATSLQSLANYRMRELGPRPEAFEKGRGNRVFYRPDRLAEWLSGGRCADWQFSGCWLQANGLRPEAIDMSAVRDRIQWLEEMDLFPPVHMLWRTFRETAAG